MRFTVLVFLSLLVCGLCGTHVRAGELEGTSLAPTRLPNGTCVVDDDCGDRRMTCEGGHCRVKTFSEAFDFWSIAAIVGAILVGSVAAVAGVGGGGILVPMYAACFYEPLAVAVALSQATITGQALLTTAMKIRLPHPQHERSLINWPIMTFWLPCSLAGTMAGNLVGKAVPDWFRIVLLLLLLSFFLFRTVLTAIRQRRKDKESQAMLSDSRQVPVGINAGNGYNAESSLDTVRSDTIPPVHPPPAPAPKPTVLRCNEIISPASLVLIVATFLPLIAVNYCMSRGPNLIECGSDVYWAVFSGALVYNFGVTTGMRAHLARVFRSVIIATGDDAAEAEAENKLPFRWNSRTNLWFPIVAITAGGAASLLGIGGGLILGVLFLEAGLTPEEVSATSGAATLLVAAESLLQYVIQGVVPLEYGLMALGAGVIGSVCGYFLAREIKRRKLSFLIVVSLATIMGGSMLALTADGAYATYYDVQKNSGLSFRDPCHS
jgi:uncharacterized membrane protein YfcA